MSEHPQSNTHWSFWLITIFMLVWNVMGCINFVVQLDSDMAASYRETEQAIIVGRPFWATAGFAVGVFGGALGCFILMLKRPVALYFFVASLVGVIVTTIHTLSVDVNFSAGEIIGIIAMPVVIAAFLIWYAKYVASKGWVRAT